MSPPRTAVPLMTRGAAGATVAYQLALCLLFCLVVQTGKSLQGHGVRMCSVATRDTKWTMIKFRRKFPGSVRSCYRKCRHLGKCMLLCFIRKHAACENACCCVLKDSPSDLIISLERFENVAGPTLTKENIDHVGL